MIVCEPTASAVVLKLASFTPLSSTSAEGGSAWPSMVNVTVPVGVPDPLIGATAAVNVMLRPTIDGLLDEVTSVDVGWSDAALTTCVTGAELLERKFPVGIYIASMACVPVLSDDVVNVAWPAALRATDRRTVDPCSKFTVPAGVPPPPVHVTVAVNVTGWPGSEGLFEEVSVAVVSATTVCARFAVVLAENDMSPL